MRGYPECKRCGGSHYTPDECPDLRIEELESKNTALRQYVAELEDDNAQWKIGAGRHIESLVNCAKKIAELEMMNGLQCQNIAILNMELKAAEKKLAANGVPVTGDTSDGYHTFNELYEHRHALFLYAMKCNPSLSTISYTHHDGSSFDGWFIAHISLPTGDVSYHLPNRLWDKAVATGATVLLRGKEWDGHTTTDVIERFYNAPAPQAASRFWQDKANTMLENYPRIEERNDHVFE